MNQSIMYFPSWKTGKWRHLKWYYDKSLLKSNNFEVFAKESLLRHEIVSIYGSHAEDVEKWEFNAKRWEI